MKVVLVLIVMSLSGEPNSMNMEQPSIEVCAQQVNDRLAEALLYLDKVKYLGAMCVVHSAPDKKAER